MTANRTRQGAGRARSAVGITKLAQEPVITIICAEDEADALRLANDTEYGLSSAVFTGNLDRGVLFAQQVEAGMTHVNDASVGNEPHLPFGGEKNSGLGRFGSQWILEEFTTVHWISVQRTPRHYLG
jgi:acyl-CoA reductase-like NAD-dependent aldehyde dehydrogenase